MPGLQHGGDAGGADLGVIVGARRQRRQRSGIGAAGQQRLHRLGHRRRLGHGHALEECTRHGIEPRRKIELREALQGVGEAIDRVVAARRGAVPAAIGDLELVGLIDLLGELDREAERAGRCAMRAAAALVDGELGVDQLAVVLQQPAHAIVRRIRKLFVGREREDDVALGLVALL